MRETHARDKLTGDDSEVDGAGLVMPKNEWSDKIGFAMEWFETGKKLTSQIQFDVSVGRQGEGFYRDKDFVRNVHRIDLTWISRSKC